MDDIQAPDTGRSNGRGRMSNSYTAGEWFMPVLFIKYIGKFGLYFDAPEDEVKKWLEEVLPPMWAQIIPPPYGIEPSVCGSNSKEAKNMSENKKPRLAEALGVEVNEKFDFVGGGFTHCCYVDSNGWLRDQNGNMCDTHAVFLINNPQYMRRRPRWTEQEVKDAQAIQRLMPKYTRIHRSNKNLSLENQYGMSYPLDINLFPSLATGQTVKLADIIGGDERAKTLSARRSALSRGIWRRRKDTTNCCARSQRAGPRVMNRTPRGWRKLGKCASRRP